MISTDAFTPNKEDSYSNLDYRFHLSNQYSLLVWSLNFDVTILDNRLGQLLMHKAEALIVKRKFKLEYLQLIPLDINEREWGNIALYLIIWTFL